jgi:hypothetical protein
MVRNYCIHRINRELQEGLKLLPESDILWWNTKLIMKLKHSLQKISTMTEKYIWIRKSCPVPLQISTALRVKKLSSASSDINRITSKKKSNIQVFWDVNVIFTDVSKGCSSSIFSNKTWELKIHPYRCESLECRNVNIKRKYTNAKFDIITAAFIED